jgi:CRISPR-associated protein Cmr2
MPHLIAISVGPVQEFIAAARRTRDLWFGSFVLSEISKAAARAIKDQGGELIFPDPSSPLTPDDDRENVANVVLAYLPNQKPEHVAAFAREAARNRWRTYADDAFRSFQNIIRSSIWNEQKDDVIECYAAWVPHNNSKDYKADRARLMRLLAGRKNYRDFLTNSIKVALPKSSLDGQRETVLDDFDRSRGDVGKLARLRLSAGEQLDVVGFTKRAAAGSRPFPSVTRVAADPWVRKVSQLASFRAFRELVEALPSDILNRIDKSRFPQYQVFPYDGAVLYSSRRNQLASDVERYIGPDNEKKVFQEVLKGIEKSLSGYSEPSPYYAILVGDGDGMGKLISQLESPEEHRKFTKSLSQFATRAAAIVEEHHGVAVYAGGDDILAFLPLDTALVCAQQLHDGFAETLRDYRGPTLSVGIAVVHSMEDLEDALEYARVAERMAKSPDRDGLAIIIHKRSGSPTGVRWRWNNHPVEKLHQMAGYFRDEVFPDKLPYDLRKLLAEYEDWPKDLASSAIPEDVIRVIRDKQPKAGRRYLKEIEKVVQERIHSVGELRTFVDELLIARELSRVFEKDRPGAMEASA